MTLRGIASKRSPLIVIEHLEPTLSEWLLIEYRHSAQIAKGNLLITNVCKKEDIEMLRGVAETTCKSATELYERAVVLDPQAEELLSPSDRGLSEVFVIGGILGDHPPRGRTRVYLTNRMKSSIPRSLGRGQYSIDGAVYVVYRVIFDEIPLTEIPYVDGLRLVSRAGKVEHEIELPYRYPLLNGSPLIHPDLLKYLRARAALSEYKVIKGED